MATPSTIDDLPINVVESMLAKDSLSIEELEGFVGTAKDPEKVKLLLLALQRAKDKEEEKLRRLEKEIEDARSRIQRADDCIRRFRETVEERPRPRMY